jgi:hypothetical protein
LNVFKEVPLDFAVFMRSARWLRQGLDPYLQLIALHAPNANPPGVLIALLPLTRFSDSVAFALWTTASIAGLWFSLEKTATALKLPLGTLFLVAAGLQGVSASIRFGQITLLLLPLMTLAWLADRQDRRTAAGAWLGALVAVKPFFGLYALYMLWRREWRTLRAMIGGAAALTAAGLLVGTSDTLSWVATPRGITEKTSHVVNGSWPALVTRAFLPDRAQPEPAYTPTAIAPRLAAVVWYGGVGREDM